MDIKTLNLILKSIDVLKFLTPVLAAIYLLTWVIQFFSEGLFHLLDKIFGLLPNIFNSFVEITADIMGQDVLMGYPYLALLCIVFWAILFKVDKIVKEKTANIDFSFCDTPKPKKPKKEPKKEKPKESKKEQKPIKEEKPQQQTPKQNHQEENEDITAFYGLLTFELKYLNDEIIDDETQKTIKHSYTKILVEKLKEKYGSVNYAVSDKVFFICNNVSLFNLFVRDIVKLNKIISQISEKRKIKTALKVCFWSSPKANPKQACSILLRINQLNYLNKVIVSKHIQKKFDKQLIKCFDFCSVGTIKLNKTNPKENDINMELFYLKTLND